MADNYTLDGDNYTKEDVLEAAEAKGLTIEDYISQYYPDDLVDSSPKPLEFSFGDNRAFTREQVLFENVEKLEDGTTKTSINKDFFNQEDQDVVGLLRGSPYSAAFDFEEVVFTNETAGGYGSFSAVKASTKDGKHSIIIESNIDGRGKTDDARTQKALEKYKQDPDSLNTFELSLVMKSNRKEQAYQKSFDDLTSFFKTHSTEETNVAIAEREQEIRKAYQEFNDVVAPSLEAIKSKYLEENLNFDSTQPESETNPKKITKTDLFTPITKTTYTPTGKVGTNIYKETSTDQPYEKELKLAMKQLGVNSVTQEVKDRAREIIVENERINLKEQKITEILEELEDGEILPISLQKYKGSKGEGVVGERRAAENLKNILTVGSKMFQKEYAAKYELFENEKHELENNKDILKFTILSKKLNNSEYQFDILEGEPTVFLQDGREVPERLINQYEKDRVNLKPRYENFFKLQNDLIDNRYNIQDSKLQLDLLRRDYNDLEAFGVRTGLGFAELALNIGGATEDMEAHKRWMDAKKQLQAKRDEYAKPIAYDNAFDSFTNFGKFAHSELSNQISIFTALAVPYAGWGTLLASSFGEQYGEMTAEEIASDGKVDYSVFEKILTSGGYAAPELVFELLTTVPLLRGAGNALRGLYGSSIRDLTLQGVKEGVGNQIPKFIGLSAAGSAGEGATTVTQNIVTGKPWYENAEHSMFSGLMFETTLAGTPVITGAITNTLTDYTASEDFRNNLKLTNKIIQDNKNLDTKIRILRKSETPGAKQKIADAINQKINNKEKIQDLANTNETILKNQKESITGRWLGWGKNNKNGMSAGTFKAYLEVTNQQEQLRIKAEEILNNKGLSQEEKNRRLKDLKQNGFTDSKGKKHYGFDTLQGARDAFRNEKNSEFNLWKADKNNKQKLNEYLEKAQDMLDNPSAERTPGWVKGLKRGSGDKDDLARILYNIDKINENLNIAKNKKGRPTALDKDLVVYDDVETAVTEMAKLGIDASVIKSVKDGSHGFDGPNEKSYIIVENMAKDDRLETKTHELSHRFLTNAVKGDPKAFKEISETIFEWAKENDKKLFGRLLRQGMMIDSAPDEILAVFLEEAAAERIDLNKKGIAGVIGYMTGKVMKDGYGVDMDFAGQSDVIKMLVGLGKKIKAGKLTLKDQAAFIKSMGLEKAQKKGEFITKLQEFGLLSPITTKMSKAFRSKAVEAVNEIEQKLKNKLKAEGKNYTKEEFQKSNEFNSIFRSVALDNGPINNYIKSLGMSPAKTQKTIQGMQDRLLGYNPQAERKTDSKKEITIGERLMSDAQFAKLDAARDLAVEAKRETPTDIGETTKEGEVKMQVAAEPDVQQEALETEDISPQAQARKAQQKVKPKESEFRNRVNFKTGGKIYNQILDSAKKTLIRAYAKTQNITDPAARERAIIEQIQKEHNSLNSPLFKQIKNWLTYGLAQETVPKGTKDIYFQNLIEFREDIAKLISTSDLVQIERLINESDRIFTVYKETLRKKADVQKAVDNRQLPPDAIRKFDKDKKINVYDKVIPSETQIVAFANQPAKIPAKDKQGNIIIKDGEALMIRSGLKGTRKDGVTKNIVNGLVLDAIMEARQSKDVQDRLDVLGVDARSVQELSAASGRPANVKFSKAVGQNDISAFIKELNSVGLTKQHATNFGKDDRQRRLAATALNTLVQEIDNEGTYSSLTPMLVEMQELINQGLPGERLSFNKIVNTTFNNHKHLFEGAEGNLYASFFEGSFSKKHITAILGLAKRITEAQINGIAFNNAIAKVQDKPTDENIKYFLRNYSKQIRTAAAIKDPRYRFLYVNPVTGKAVTMTKNTDIVEHIIKPTGNKNFKAKDISKGKQRIFYKREELKTYQNSTETKKIFKENNNEKVSEAIEINRKESAEAIDFVFDIINSDMSLEDKISRIKAFFADTDAGGRKIALFAVMAKGELKTDLDHRPPINVVKKEIIEAIENPQKLSELRTFLESTRINNIPSELHALLNKPTDKGGLGKKIEGGMEVMENVDVIEAMQNVKTTSYNGVKFSKTLLLNNLGKNIVKGRVVKESNGISILDFDDTLATTKSLVKFTRPDGTTGTLNAEQYASTYESLLDQGYTFDFSDFNKVVKGKLAPLFQKALKLQNKFGPKNMFVLTARPPAAQKAIFDFLKANGLNIPLKNITGLGNSTAEAKALWVADKVGEGYNDFYFADDALQNVEAVKNMLDQFDVKSKVQQAKVKFSKSMDEDFNKILEEVTGIEAKKRFSDIKARKRGESKGKFRLFIPPSHEDFVGLLYNFMGKGRRGDQHRNFFEQALVRPLNRAYREIDTAKQAIANDYKALNKQFSDIKNKLTKKTQDGDFTFEDAIRVYLWNKHGHDIPGLSSTDQNNLVDLVINDANLRNYADQVDIISKQETYVEPGKGWEGGNIRTDLIDATGRVVRAKYFTEFNENAEILFSEENLNKIEAAYGADFRSALEDMLHRIGTGINRPKGQHATVNKFMNYLNGSVGTVMFFNVRSAILQQMSIVNYINFADNNMFAAAKAFANQKQYWQDFAFIFNSDMLKQRRGGIGTDINGNDLAQAVAGSKNPTKVAISYLLKLGFLPTQIGDNIAIATGGATFYRNRINKYIKDGLSKKEAETKAFTDFQDLTQSTQQSSRPDMTSQQQASWIGKLVLNFQNITSQYNRIIKKAALDIKNKRISPPYTTRTQSNLGNLSKILYYGAIQNVIFYSLQTALFAIMFDDDQDEDKILKKRERVIQGTIDSILRGSGIYGAVLSTLKNTLIKFKEQREKGYNKDESAVALELANFSPVLGIKLRQIVNAEKTLNYNENVISEMETFQADNPQWSAVTNYTQALTNFPANRLYQKSINMRNALDKDYTNFQRVMFFSGYTTWSLGLGDSEAVIEAKEKSKINKKNKKKSKRKTFKKKTFKRKTFN